VGLFLTNPTREQFAEVFAREAGPEVTRQLGVEGTLGNLLQGATQGMVRATLEEQVVRENYLLASQFILPLPGEDLRVLGIAGQFIQLSGRQ
jgi:hypothetical protein